MKRYYKWFFIISSLSLVTVPIILTTTSCSETVPSTYKIDSVKDLTIDTENKVQKVNSLSKDVLESKSKYNKILLDFTNLSQFDGYQIILPSNISQADKITQFEIKGLANANLGISSSSLEIIANWTDLTSLELIGLNIKSFIFIKKLTNLTYLDLTSNILTDISMVLDYNLVRLEHLDLTNNSITSIG